MSKEARPLVRLVVDELVPRPSICSERSTLAMLPSFNALHAPIRFRSEGGVGSFAHPISHKPASSKGARAKQRSKASSAQSASPRPGAARRNVVTRAAANASSGQSQSAERHRELLDFVRDVQPSHMETFVEQAPPAVVSAMRTTITNMLGTLPPAFFTVTVSTVGENLAQLMYSVQLTGYAFRNAQFRMELRNSLGSMSSSSTLSDATATTSSSSSINGATTLLRGTTTSSASSAGSMVAAAAGSDSRRCSAGPALVLAGGPWSDDDEESAYAPGVQKSRVQGEVLMWHKENGLEAMEAVAYMELLEQENARLRQQLTRSFSAPATLPPPTLPPAPAAAAAAASTLPVAGPPPSIAASSVPAAVSPAMSGHPNGLALRGEEPANELLDFLRALPASSVAELTACAGGEVTQAMDAFIQRLLGTGDQDQLRRAQSECNTQELGRLMFWLMVVGYSLRGMEVRLDMEGSLDPKDGGSPPSSRPGLPPGRL